MFFLGVAGGLRENSRLRGEGCGYQNRVARREWLRARGRESIRRCLPQSARRWECNRFGDSECMRSTSPALTMCVVVDVGCGRDEKVGEVVRTQNSRSAEAATLRVGCRIVSEPSVGTQILPLPSACGQEHLTRRRHTHQHRQRNNTLGRLKLHRHVDCCKQLLLFDAAREKDSLRRLRCQQ